jgi:glutamate dehydrogenase
VLQVGGAAPDSAEQIRRWLADTEPAVSRCLAILHDVAADDRTDLATLSVALREVRGLISGRSA